MTSYLLVDSATLLPLNGITFLLVDGVTDLLGDLATGGSTIVGGGGGRLAVIGLPLVDHTLKELERRHDGPGHRLHKEAGREDYL